MEFILKTRTSFSRTLKAQDYRGKEYLIEEYHIDKEVITSKGLEWQKLDCLLFLNGNIVKYREDDDTFIVMEKNHILKHVS